MRWTASKEVANMEDCRIPYFLSDDLEYGRRTRRNDIKAPEIGVNLSRATVQ